MIPDGRKKETIYGNAWLGVVKKESGMRIIYIHSVEDADGVHEVVKADMPLICEQGCIWFREKIRDGEKVTAEFSFSTDGKNYQVLPETFVLLSHTWVGAKTGIFAIAQDCQKHQGYADFEYVEYHNMDKVLP